MTYDNVLKNDERAVLSLRSLYKAYGYQPFKMSKFEEYDLYALNKDFLVSDRVITFTDTDGRLLALKPDVTLSIIKSSNDTSGKRKVYYDENVYRISPRSGQFSEIMQTGIECIGDIDVNDIYETIYLAAESLSEISESFVLDISHMGVVNSILTDAGCSDSQKKEITRLISERNLHELEAFCCSGGISDEYRKSISKLAETYGDRATVISELEKICRTVGSVSALNELKTLDKLLSGYKDGEKVRFDFSIVNNMNYYNGIVFKGFVNGISESVLSGGEYAKLLSNMGIRGNGIGFALYLDRLDELDVNSEKYDVDVVIVYSDETSPEYLLSQKQEYVSMGLSVAAYKSEPPAKIIYKQLVELD